MFFCENHTKHINNVCGRNAEFLNVKTGGKCSYRCAVKG
jgi:hypothetical protein